MHAERAIAMATSAASGTDPEPMDDRAHIGFLEAMGSGTGTYVERLPLVSS